MRQQQQQQQRQDWTSVPSKKSVTQQKRRIEEKEAALVTKPEPVYLPFPSKHAHLKESVIPWAEQGAYFVFCGEGTTKRFFHVACSGKTNIREEIPPFIQSHPVVVLDLSVYPMLMDDQEWVYSIMQVNPAYKPCTCSFVRYILDEKACRHYRLEKPYFYLCNMNWPDDMGEKAILLEEETLRRKGRK